MRRPPLTSLRTPGRWVLPALALALLVACGPKVAVPEGDGGEAAQAFARAVEGGDANQVMRWMAFTESDPKDPALKAALAQALGRVKGLEFRVAEEPAKRSDEATRRWPVVVAVAGGDEGLGEGRIDLTWTPEGWRVPEAGLKPLIDAGAKVLRDIARDSMRARVQMRNLSMGVDMYRLTNRKLPQQLADLTVKDPRTGEPIMQSIPQDPWGRPYTFEPRKEGRYVLRTAGADGKPDTADDLVHPPEDDR